MIATQTRAKAEAVRFRTLSPFLNCDTLAVYYYRATCACEWHGPRRKKMGEARRDARAHRCAAA